MPRLNFDKLDRSVVWVGTFREAEERDREFWRSLTPYQRLRALEHIRQWNHGYGKGGPRPKLQRVLKVVKLRAR